MFSELLSWTNEFSRKFYSSFHFILYSLDNPNPNALTLKPYITLQKGGEVSRLVAIRAVGQALVHVSRRSMLDVQLRAMVLLLASPVPWEYYINLRSLFQKDLKEGCAGSSLEDKLALHHLKSPVA